MNARTRRLLRLVPVVNVYSAAEIVLLAGLAVQVARLAWAVVTPVAPLGEWRPAPVVLPGTPYDVLTGFDPFFRNDAAQGPATVTSLQLRLFGTRIDEAMGRGSAIIAGPDGVQNSVAVGDEIVPNVRLKAVSFDHVVIDRGGTDENLYLDQSASLAPAAATAPAPAGAGVVPVAGGPPLPSSVGGVRLQDEIGFIPRLDGGRISGLVVRPQSTGDVFRRAGLREGDVVTAIGGRPVTGAGDFDRFAAQAATGAAVPITVERGNQTLPLSISVTPK